MIVLRPGTREVPAYTDADYSISEATAEDLAVATPENTARAYDRAWSQFGRWCAGTGRIVLPATARTLAEYVRVMTHAELAPATVEQAIGAIRSRHRKAGYKEQPDTEEALELLRGYRVAWARQGTASASALRSSCPSFARWSAPATPTPRPESSTAPCCCSGST